MFSKFNFILSIYGESLLSVMGNVLDYKLKVSEELELRLLSYVYFWTVTIGKGMNHSYTLTSWLKSNTSLLV